jgi:hypothetical protein
MPGGGTALPGAAPPFWHPFATFGENVMLNLSKYGLAVLLCTLGGPGIGHEIAQERELDVAWQPAPDVPATVSALPAMPAQQRQGAGLFGAPLADDRLATQRGGTETPWSDMRLNGAVSGNSAVAVLTGNNTITEGSFSNASGLPMVIQNTGANVLIQNATIVNIQFK